MAAVDGGVLACAQSGIGMCVLALRKGLSKDNVFHIFFLSLYHSFSFYHDGPCHPFSKFRNTAKAFWKVVF